MALFFRSVALGFVGFAILASELSLVGVQSRFLTLRQPTSGAPVQRLGKHQALNLHMQSAKRWADRLDAQSLNLLAVSSMGSLERWRRGVNLESLQTQYSKDMMAHLKSMTAIMKARREKGGFKKLREFDFQNMVRKSDYLLSLNVTKNSLDYFSQDAKSEEAFRQVLALYNQERLLFDHKMIALAEN